MHYGIWITRESWACLDGGDDLIGTEEEMLAKAEEWAAEETGRWDKVHFEVRPYTGECGDFMDEFVEKRTKANPNFPAMIEAALERRRTSKNK